jgi:hypothetical protein
MYIHCSGSTGSEIPTNNSSHTIDVVRRPVVDVSSFICRSVSVRATHLKDVFIGEVFQ